MLSLPSKSQIQNLLMAEIHLAHTDTKNTRMYVDSLKLTETTQLFSSETHGVSIFPSVMGKCNFFLSNPSKQLGKEKFLFLHHQGFQSPCIFFRLYKLHIHGLWQSTGTIRLTFQIISISRAFIPHPSQIIRVSMNIHFAPKTFKERQRIHSHHDLARALQTLESTLYAKNSLPRENFLMFLIRNLLKLDLGKGFHLVIC